MDGTMKTLLVLQDGSLEVRDVPIPAIGPRQALVKTIACGICNGTDAKLIHRTFKGVGPEQYPLMLGHEGVGEVVETGCEVTGFHIGDRVLLPFVSTDPQRYPGIGSAWGAYSEYAVVDDPAAYPDLSAPECAYAQTIVPDWIDPVDSVMIITLREVLSSIRRFGIHAGDSVAVFGCGPVGLTFIRLLKLMQVHPIIALDIREDKLADALACGADYVFDSTRTEVISAIRSICPDGVRCTIDAVGHLPLINQSMECLADGGKTCCYGIAAQTSMQLDWSRAPYNWQVHFQQFPSKKEEGEANQQILSWLADGSLHLKDYISDYFDFDQILAAFEKLEAREIAKKGIVVYGAYRSGRC